MKNARWLSIASANSVAVLVAFSLCLLALGNDRGDLRKRASWNLPTRDEVRAQVDAWLNGQSSSFATREEVAAIWSAAGSQGESDLLERVVASIAVVDPRAVEVAARMQPGQSAEFAKFAWLREELTPPFVRFNLRLAYGRWLSQQGYFDESLEELGGLLPEQVVDPGALLFYQSVAYHKLLKKEECLAALGKLLENDSLLPRRYVTVARLMEADIRPLEIDSLDEIARLMSDIRRRLGLGRAGTRVRQQEDDVVAKLDKKIKEIEEQMKKQSASGQGQGNLQPNNPAPDSQNLGGKGPGDVDAKRIGSKSGWGNLPPKEREQALQQISKDLPAHYREAIEEYFRKLAREGEER